MDLLYWKLFLQ